jgi:hypothetical protein
MILGVVGGAKPRQPLVRLFLAFGLMKVIEGLVGLFDGSERPFDPRVKPEGRLVWGLGCQA